ncbi:MAG: TonB-dependent receptor [Edaphobacter sp.]|uniref:TonB-dependent receptor n=1 Tax=Edaphobacter sp. TaxID=1934404 RepID=UPI0023A4AC0E|nr:TonB-dependent receptor [Edaphobacter sp.]MDE1175508.1 TonB-dependent receptor [Edaphobacter sp.]
MQFLVKLVLSVALGSVLAYADDRAVRVCVHDEQGRAIGDAQVLAHTKPVRLSSSDGSGCAVISVSDPAAMLEISHAGFATLKQQAGVGDVDVVLRVASTNTVVDVTAQRTPLSLDASASSVRTMTKEQYEEAPGFNLDDRLRQVAGFQLFRRTGSWVANPTTQGTSLHGLASTAASRTLVLSDQIPLNDPFGGWIHWNEIPQLAVRNIELMRGGASDLYGSSAIGGVINVLPVTPEKFSYALDLAGASENTSSLNGLLAGTYKGWKGLAATSIFQTGGYILIAPEIRGAVDVPSNVHSQSGRIELHHDLGPGSVFLRGNLLNEARSNGTPVTTNATRIWRYAAGGDWSDGGDGRFLLRLHGASQGYRQSFSSVVADRSSERLTRLQVVPSSQLGAIGQWAHTYHAWTVVAGSDVLDTRGNDRETPYGTTGAPQTTVSTTARQRDTGVYGEALWQPKGWSVALSSRVDRFSTFDAKQAGATTPLPTVSETIFNPRLGVVRQLPHGVALTGSVFRAFRGPSLNELYRTGQVGQQTTLANPSLRSERATGWEAGGLINLHHIGTVRSSYFWTQVNRPIAAVQISATTTSQTLMRQNLGQLLSKGVTAELEMHPVSFLMLTAGYQYANSTVSKFQADPTLAGKWTAQVPRNSATVQARMEKSQWGVFAVDVRASGKQYDDTANQYELDPFAQVDLYAEHKLRKSLRLYMSVQNLANSRIQAGRTPQLTLAAPRIIMGGIRLW